MAGHAGCGAWLLHVVLVAVPPAAIALPVAANEGGVRSSSPLLDPLAPPPGASRRALAEGYLRRARAWWKASCELANQHDCRAVEGYYAACEAAWDAIWTCPEAPDILGQAAIEYAASLDGLLSAVAEHGRYDPQAGIWVGPPQRRIAVPVQTRGLPVDASAVEAIVAAPPPTDKRISRCHLREGFGLPVSVRAARPCGTAIETYSPARQSLAATAVLRFPRPPEKPRMLESVPGPLALDPAPAVLDLVNPVEASAVHIGDARPQLAADLTAPLLDMLEGMPSQPIANFLQTYSISIASGEGQPRLVFLEPWQPGKIPVVFIHGLASDEGTWFDLLNELRTWPEFHRRYQPWVFHYPTGSSFLRVSLLLRRQLTLARETLDPGHRDAALSRMVLVGHSMGGLHAKLQVVRPGDAIWSRAGTRPIETIRFPDVSQLPGADQLPAELRVPGAMRRDFIEQFYFEPRPFVRRVIYIATPHGGSSLASRAVGRAASLLVRRPPAANALHDAIVAANPGAATPAFEEGVPTTIDVLEPSSPFLLALRGVHPSCGVTTHSIIGDMHHSLSTGPGDCVVPVSSARESGVASEVFVPASHTKVHHHPFTVAEVIRILDEHAACR